MHPDNYKDVEVVERKVYDDYRTVYSTNLRLYSKVIKNCELIDDLDFRKQHLERCVMHWANLLLLILVLAEDDLEKDSRKELEGKKEEAKYFLRVMLPLVFGFIVHENLGSEKLEKLISEGIDRSTNEVLKLLHAFLYSDLRLPGYINKLREVTRHVHHHKYSLELMFYKAYSYYMLRKLSEGERGEMERLIAEIHTRIASTGKKVLDDRLKGRYINQLRSNFLKRRPRLKQDL